MKAKYVFRVVCALGMLFALQSCGTSVKPLYSWYNYDDLAYEYSKSKSEKTTAELVEVYQKLIEKQKESRGTVPPGICAEYGYLLIKQGKTEQGMKYLERETELYPESKLFIGNIIKQFKK